MATKFGIVIIFLSVLATASFARAQQTLSAGQVDELATRMRDKGFSDKEVGRIAQSMGISGSQVEDLKSHVRSDGPSQNGAPSAPTPEAGNIQPPPQSASRIELEFQSLTSAKPANLPAPQPLQQFGYSVFATKVSTFAPVANVPVGPDYLMGPGDKLRLLMWGRINQTFDLPVERDGTILVPEIGPLQITGLTFDQARTLIRNRAAQITGVHVEVTMGTLRTIQVSVVGEVQHPGVYTISALSHISNALVAAGGVSKTGSLRRIELRRGNQLVRVFDIYDMLLKGKNGDDERLESQDVIFVPVIGPVAAVAGDVKRPAIYEFKKEGESLGNLIDLAGGIGAFAYGDRLQVERVENHRRMIALDVAAGGEDRLLKFNVKDGDIVKIFPILGGQQNIVTITGNVRRPGDYQWYSGMRVADAIREAEGVSSHTFFDYALIERLEGPDQKVRIVPIDLGAALADHQAGIEDIALRPKDTLNIFNDRDVADLPEVAVEGEVRKPGQYRLSHGMRVSDLIYLAGGLKRDAYQVEAELARTRVVHGARTLHTYADVDLKSALSGAAAQDPLLEPDDQLFVRRAIGWHLPWVVQVKGEVLRPGPYTIHQGERLVSVLKRCGGMLPDAYLPGAVFIRKSVMQLQQKRLDESRARLEQQIAQLRLMPAKPGETDQSRGAEAQAFLERLLQDIRSRQAAGRVVLNMRPLAQMAASPENVLLENQDQITIPRRPSIVNVLGQVYNPTAIVYRPGLTVGDYLQRAGGPTENADPDHTFVVKANGAILTQEGITNEGKARLFPLLPVISGGMAATTLWPGDTVYVPEKLVYSDNLKYVTDITQIIASTAQAVAVVGLLATHP